MFGDKKKVVSAILGKGGESVAHMREDAGADTHHVISEELIDALHNKDAKGVSEALKASHAHLSAQGSEEPSEG